MDFVKQTYERMKKSDYIQENHTQLIFYVNFFDVNEIKSTKIPYKNRNSIKKLLYMIK